MQHIVQHIVQNMHWCFIIRERERENVLKTIDLKKLSLAVHCCCCSRCHSSRRCRGQRWMMMRMMYQGRNSPYPCSSHCVALVISGVRARYRGLLFFRWRSSLRQTLETLERVVYEHPILVDHLTVLWHWC